MQSWKSSKRICLATEWCSQAYLTRRFEWWRFLWRGITVHCRRTQMVCFLTNVFTRWKNLRNWKVCFAGEQWCFVGGFRLMLIVVNIIEILHERVSHEGSITEGLLTAHFRRTKSSKRRCLATEWRSQTYLTWRFEWWRFLWRGITALCRRIQLVCSLTDVFTR